MAPQSLLLVDVLRIILVFMVVKCGVYESKSVSSTCSSYHSDLKSIILLERLLIIEKCQISCITWCCSESAMKPASRRSGYSVVRLPRSTLGLIVLSLVMSGDVETNPGPTATARVCNICDSSGRCNQLFVTCNECSAFSHKTCAKLKTSAYRRISLRRDRWTCWKCSMPQLSNSYFDLPGELSSSVHSINMSSERSAPCTKLSVLSFNARSLMSASKQRDIRSALATLDPSIVCVCETWLYDSINDAEVLPDTHLLFRNDRFITSGGGVLIAARPELNPVRLTQLETDAETVWVEILCGGNKFLIGSVYRAPNSSMVMNDSLLESLSRVQLIQHSYNAVYICGDWNLDISWNPNNAPIPHTPVANQFLTSFYDLFLSQLICEATRITQSSRSILDLFLTNVPSSVQSVEVIPGFSDHLAIMATLQYNRPSPKKVTKYVYNYARANWDQLSLSLLQLLPTPYSLCTSDINYSWNAWKSTLSTCIDQAIPKSKLRNHRQAPWISKLIVASLKKRNALFKQWKKAPSEVKWEKYRIIRNLVKNNIRNAYEQYIHNIGLDSKVMWKFVRSKCGNTAPASYWFNGKQLFTAEDIASSFSAQFKENFTQQPTTPFSDEMLTRRSHSLQPLRNLYFSEAEVYASLKKIRPGAATGPDGIPCRIILKCAAAIAPSLCALYNLSINSGTVPQEWKIADVVPIYKKGHKSNVENYRPISLTSIICKCMERLVAKAMLEYLREGNLLNNNQHGFLPGRSCTTMLTKVIDEWQYSMDQTDVIQVDCVSLDWSKAFDQVPHQRLLLKLQQLNIQGKLLAWLRSFLEGRSQCVVFNGARSHSVQVTSGVPQGSVLGPLLFTAFVHDLPGCVSSTISQYADDTIIYRPIFNISDTHKLQSDLDNINIWCSVNAMNLNTSKCNVLSIVRARDPIPNTYNLSGTTLPSCSSLKLLGVTITSNLKWNLQTEEVRSKATKVLGFIQRCLRGTKSSTLKLMYLSLVRPILTYGFPAWHPTSVDNIRKLESVQNRAIKLISKHGHRATYPLPTIDAITKQADIVFLKKILTGQLLLNPYHRLALCYRSVHRGQGVTLFPPFARTCAFQAGFYYRAAKLWNALPSQIRSLPTVQLKNKIKHLDH